MSINIKLLPKQRISKTQKGKKWGESCVEALDRISYDDTYNGRASRYRKQINYDLYNGRLDFSDFEYVTNPYGFKEDEFPATLQHYDIISPKLNLLLGEEIKRPFNFRAVSVNADAVSSYEEERKKYIKDATRSYIESIVSEEPEAEEVYSHILKNMDKNMKYSFSDMREKYANHSLNHLKKAEELEYKFNLGFKDALITDEEIFWTGIINGEPVMRVVNPLDVSVIMDSESYWIDESYAIVEERWMTLPKIMDEFGQKLSDPEQRKLDDEYNAEGNFGLDSSEVADLQRVIKEDTSERRSKLRSRNHDLDGTIRVVRVEWKSQRKVGFLYTGEDLQERDLVDETYEIPEDAEKDTDGFYHFDDMKLKWYWINEYWEGNKIGEHTYTGIQPKKNQRRNIDNPSICKSGYTGLIFNARNAQSASPLDRAKPYQYLYNIIYYRLELAIAKSKGKLALMDIAQIPQSEGWDVDKWMYYLDALGVMFINSHEEGPDGQRDHQFNQFQSIDLTMGNFINMHVDLLNMIEDKVGDLLGVSRQRQGQVSSSELVGSVERSITQSSHITEHLFFLHNEVKRKTLEALLDCSRIAWKEGKTLNYVSDDMSREFLKIDGSDYANTQYAVHIGNSTKDIKNLETMRQLLQSAIQADKVALSEVTTILGSDSFVEMRKVLEDGEEKAAQRTQQAAEQQSQAQQALMDSQIADKQADRDLDREKNLRDNDTKLAIAFNQPEDGEIGDDSLDREKLDLDRSKHRDDTRLKEKELTDRKDIAEKDLKLKKEDLTIKRKQSNNPKK